MFIERVRLVFTVLITLAPILGMAADASAGAALATRQPVIGRLFFSPAERQKHRLGESTDVSSVPLAVSPPATDAWVVNGAINSSSRTRAVWVNGVPIDASQSHGPAWTDQHGNTWLNDGTHAPRRIRAGQSLDHKGVLKDLLPPGAVTQR